MRPHEGLLAAVAVLCSGLSVLAAAAPQGTSVRGAVVRSDGSPVADLAVRLEALDTESVVFQTEGRTDASGTVVWSDLQVPVASLLRMAADYDGATYVSDLVPADAGASVELLTTVAEVTREGRPLHLDTLHLIVQVAEPGVYSVLQFMTISNAGSAAWAGGPDLPDGRRAGIVVPLPADATEVRPAPFPNPSDALPASEIVIEPGRVLDPRPVPPRGRQVAITYELSPGGDEVPVSLLVPYPAQSVSVLIGGPGAAAIEVRDSTLSRQPPQQIGDQTYEVWTAEAVAPDTEIRFTLAIPGAGMSTAALATVALGIALLGAALATLRGGAVPADAHDRLEGLVAEIALLDAQHESGSLDTPEYFLQRATAVERAMLLQEALGVGGPGSPVSAARSDDASR